MNDLETKQHDLWQEVRKQLTETKLPLKLRNNIPSGSYYDVKFGVPSAYLSLHYVEQENCAKVMVSLRNERGEKYFEHLLREKEQIEGEIGASLDWDPVENAKYCCIVLWKKDVDLGISTTTADLAQWYVTWFENFYKALHPRLSIIPE
ncbi:DUF4268 domain-containing protein [Pseudovibrio sp. Tun.PSC04-5.I4]|uniref:DUF4268 domain-containing protein n=1 Tax=Pseudovibrio sp. Tun.PSC04-5.I4 TaxID=1798213 RepID=UPI000B862F76|nr:DUF4268 domain-containing protein [Pseudovibrio sp. Tun.PSC04-5.I4]